MKMGKIPLKRVIAFLLLSLLHFNYVTANSQNEEPEISEDTVPCPHLPSTVSNEEKRDLGWYCTGTIILEEAVHSLSGQDNLFFVSACVVDHAKYMDEGAIAVLISFEGTEMVYLKRPGWDYNVVLGWAKWENEDVKPGTFEIWNGGAWSQAFAAGIYNHLIELPFERRTKITLPEISELASERICDVDHSWLDGPWK